MSSIAPSAHTRGDNTTDDWITPKWLIEKLGPFDLDPCESDTQPWLCARRSYKKDDDGKNRVWHKSESVWLNPPYGVQTAVWLGLLAMHGNGIALVFARTETKMFFDHVWPKASALLFLKGRLTFCRPDGTEGESNSGGPSVLIGYGEEALKRLKKCSDLGKFVVLPKDVARDLTKTIKDEEPPF